MGAAAKHTSAWQTLPAKRKGGAASKPFRLGDRLPRSPRKGRSTLRNRQVSRGDHGQRAACTATVILTPGVPYSGDTTGAGNKFDSTDYPSLPWGEYGPDVVHQISVSATRDLRIHITVDPVTLPDLDVILLDGTGGPCDTVNWTYAGDDTVIAKSVAPGTYYIIVDGYQAGDYGPYTLTAAVARDLLLVDDDGSGDPSQCISGCPDVRPYYTDALRMILGGPAWSAWDVTLLGSPDAATLNNSKYVIWFCGGAYNSGKTITPTDEALLKGYLDLGGRLLLVGQDILWDLNSGNDGRLPEGSFMDEYLQVNEVFQDVWDSQTSSFTVDGVPGEPIGDLLNCNDLVYVFDQFTYGPSIPFTAYADSLVSRFGDPVYYNNWISGDTRSQKPVGVRYETSLGQDDYYKTLFLAFAPECDDPAVVTSEMANLISKTITWFDRGASSVAGDALDSSAQFDDSILGNNNGIPDPGETFNLIVTVTNNDMVAHNVKVYLAFEDYYVTRYVPYCVDLGSIGAFGGTGQATFKLRMISTTPLGYRVNPEVNLVLNDSGESFADHRGFGIFVGQADVLLVKDEGLAPNTTGVDIYTSILSNLGYTTAVWDTDLFAAPTYDLLYLPNDRMINYPFVIWFTGLDSSYTLTPTSWETALGIDPEAELKSYLDNRQLDAGVPARLILSSQDYLWDKYGGVSGPIPAVDFGYTHLKVQSVLQDYLKDASATIYGSPGVYASDWMQMGVQNGQTFTNFADQVAIQTDESDNRPLWSYQLDPQELPAATVSVAKTLAARMAFLAFAFENVQDATPGGFHSKQRFLERLLCQMKMGSGDTVPPCGYYLPAPGATVLLNAVRSGVQDAFLSWSPVAFQNLNAEPITGFYRLRRGACGSLVTGPLDLPILARPSVESFLDPGAPDPTGDCYNVIDYEDLFGQPALLNQ